MPAPAGVDVVYGDATDGTAMASLVAGGRDVVYAAGTSLPLAVERDPAQLVEPLRALVTVLEAVRINAGSSLLFLSSGGTVYGEPGHLPVTEDHPLRPRSAYGSEMVAAETYVAYYARRHGVAATSLRCANAYGPGQQPHRGQGLIATVLDAATHGQAVEVWGDGSAVRDYVFIDDLATAVVALLGRADLPEALNLGSGVGASVHEVLELVEATTGRALRVHWRGSRPFDVSRVVLDITRLRSLIAFEPTPLAVGIRDTWAAISRSTVA